MHTFQKAITKRLILTVCHVLNMWTHPQFINLLLTLVISSPVKGLDSSRVCQLKYEMAKLHLASLNSGQLSMTVRQIVLSSQRHLSPTEIDAQSLSHFVLTPFRVLTDTPAFLKFYNTVEPRYNGPEKGMFAITRFRNIGFFSIHQLISLGKNTVRCIEDFTSDGNKDSPLFFYKTKYKMAPFYHFTSRQSNKQKYRCFFQTEQNHFAFVYVQPEAIIGDNGSWSNV